MAETGSATIAVKVINVTDKVLIPEDIFTEFKDAVERMLSDNEATVLADSLTLTRLARQLIEQAEYA